MIWCLTFKILFVTFFYCSYFFFKLAIISSGVFSFFFFVHDSTPKLPLSPWVIFLLMLRPSPCEVGFISLDNWFVVLKYGLNSYFWSSGLIPIPLSMTLIVTFSSFKATFTNTLLLGRENLTALLSKFSKTYWTLISSIIRFWSMKLPSS